MQLNKYESPEITLIELDNADIITSSNDFEEGNMTDFSGDGSIIEW